MCDKGNITKSKRNSPMNLGIPYMISVLSLSNTIVVINSPSVSSRNSVKKVTMPSLWSNIINIFTEKELDFIINYDIKYRMGDELNEE